MQFPISHLEAENPFGFVFTGLSKLGAFRSHCVCNVTEEGKSGNIVKLGAQKENAPSKVISS